MSEKAPEMIGIRLDDMTAARNAYFARPIPERFIEIEVIPYRRADIAWLPEELVERVKYARDAINEAHPTEYAALHLVAGARHIFRDILEALEPQR